MSRNRILAIGMLASAGVWGIWWFGQNRGTSRPGTEEGTLAYVGREVCADCHVSEAAAWSNSHHDLAMGPATTNTVLGDFDGTSFVHGGVRSTFSSGPDGFQIETEGPDGARTRFPVAYTFGVDPLQQYLVEMDDGRLQAFTVAWDARPAEDGGNRWFHLYPEEVTPPGDVLHWTGAANTWNYMCAECHSTGLQKGYDPTTNRYETTWSDVNVGCEACHGPGSAHLDWAQAGSAAAPDDSRSGGSTRGRYGLTAQMSDEGGGQWAMDAATGIAARTSPPDDAQIETCARCHSRRASLAPEKAPGGPLMDSHLPRTLAEGLYYADGQILDEVYVYGSFLQSPMYQAGVRCSDCHEPHSLELRAEGNGVCASCHATTRFDTPEHHHHTAGTEAAQCVSCHMPSTTYMVVDPRRDHSFRVPRPDLAAGVDAPDACRSCHVDRSSGWAAEAVAEWYGPDRRSELHYGQVIAAGRAGSPQSEPNLAVLVADTATPAIVRATALELLAARPGQMLAMVLQNGLRDPDPLVRVAAARATEVIPPQNRLQFAGGLLADDVLAVRTEAARVLASVPGDLVPPVPAQMLERALAEYEETLGSSLDHPSAHVSLALLYAARNRLAEAEETLVTALEIGPWFIPARVNLTDLYRSQGRDPEGEVLLREGIAAYPDEARLHYTLGLLLARTDRTDQAVGVLERAAALDPDDVQLAYTHAIALNSLDREQEALSVLAQAAERDPNNRDVLAALATINRDAGRPDRALPFARRLAELVPEDPGIAELIRELEASL